MYVGIQQLDSTSNSKVETHWSTVSGNPHGFLCPSTPYSLNSSKVIPSSNQLLDLDSIVDQCSTTPRRSSLQFQVSLHGVIHYQLLSSINNHQLPVGHGHLPAHLSHSQHHLISLKPVALLSLLLGHLVPQILSSSQLITESCDPPSLDESVESPQQNPPSISATTGDQPVGMSLRVIAKGF